MHQSIGGGGGGGGQPRGICSRCQSLGRAFEVLLRSRELGINVPRGDPRAFGTRVFKRTDGFIGKDVAFVKDWLVRQGVEKLVDVFKGMFSQC